MKELIMVKYGEIILKGLNRPVFENVLVKNIRNSLKNTDDVNIQKAQATIYIEPSDSEKTDIIMERLSKIFGIVSIARAAVCEKNIDDICRKSLEYCGGRLSGKKFKVVAKRADKGFALKSPEICDEVGGYLLENISGLSADMHDPDFTVRVEVRDFGAYVYCDEDKIKGQGGMPIGTGDKATLLLSGGIDSPVAGHMISKRGVTIDAVNFFSYPYTSERAKDKVIELASILAGYTSKINLHIVPFTEIQLAIRDKCPEEQLTLIMRRFMMKIAEIIAKRNHSSALITGESVGQVASQTISALNVTNSVVDMPVLRPLIGMDKEEIIVRARNIGTFETSILPYEDCCTIFTPKHPKTHPKLDRIIKSESMLDADALIKDAVDNIEFIEVYPS